MKSARHSERSEESPRPATSFREVEVEIQSAAVRLAGTFCRPALDGPFPSVVFIHGSGPLDRNENLKGQRLDIFNAIAHGLAEHGIASLRYDKRGCGASTGSFLRAGHEDLVTDAFHCVDALNLLNNVDRDRVFVLGHSEGCIVAPRVCLRRPHVAGMVLLCPFIDSLEPLALKQAGQLGLELENMPGLAGRLARLLGRVFGNPVARQKRLIRRLRSTTSPVLWTGAGRLPAKWLRELMAVDPSDVFASTTTPLLLIGGEKDAQCDPGDVFRIAQVARAPSETWVVENMTHVLRTTAEPPSISGSARLLGRPIERSLVERIARWIQSIGNARPAVQPAPQAGAPVPGPRSGP